MRKRDIIWAEVRAAEIAINVHEHHPNAWKTTHELAGWMRAADNREGLWPKPHPATREWHAGYLAAQIWYEVWVLSSLDDCQVHT
jgi:hypothetical protein